MNRLWKKSKGKFKKIPRNNNENTTIKNLWDTEKSVLRGDFIVSLPEGTKISNKQLNLIPKATTQRRTNKTQS